MTWKFLEKLLLYSILLFLPTQLGKHFWPSFSYVQGLRIDYLSPTLYVTDILIGLLFITWSLLQFSRTRIKNKELRIRGRKIFIIHNSYFIIPILVYIGSIIPSLSPIAGFYKLLKVLEFSFFGFYIARMVNWKKDFPAVLTLLSIGVLFESLLAIAQFIKQASIGGPLWFLGERTFSGQTPGIANANLDGRLVLRPYGTFSHPNVLAGYLVIIMTVFIYNLKSMIGDFRKKIWMVPIIIGTIALLLTLSRVAILLWFLALGLLLIKNLFKMQNKKLYAIRYTLLTIFIVVSIGSITSSPLSSRFTSLVNVDKESFIKRQELNSAAIEMFKHAPIFGVGLNSFLITLPQHQKPRAGPLWLQPVHNIYLLILSETGVVGFSLFLLLIGKTYIRIKDQGLRIKNQNFILHHSSFIIFSLVLILGLFDHYFFTLQQGQLLFAFVMGLAWSKFG